MDDENENYRKAISVVLKKDDEFLITHTEGWDAEVWCFIQGGIEEGETEEEAVLQAYI